MVHGLKIIGLILLINLSISILASADPLWSRKIMNCKKGECLIDEITWQSNQEYKNHQGHLTGETKHYCKKPQYWIPILRSLINKNMQHNNILLKQVKAGKCYELSFPKKIVLFETVISNTKWEIKRAQWLYDQPEEFYQGFLK